MSATDGLIHAVSQRLHTFLTEQSSAEFGAEAEMLFRQAQSATSGGKRLRARFCIAGWQAVGGSDILTDPDTHRLIGLAAALELFHAAALVHDDVIDNSATRRGQAAAHHALASAHREALWAGDPDAFGISAAILLGDLLVAWSDDLFEQTLTDVPGPDAVRQEYARMRSEVTIGQFLDIAEESAFRVAAEHTHVERALRVATLKSARYSVQRPLAIGAALAGASSTQQDALAEYGLPIGIAFQLRDDLLGVFGLASETGKPSGDDLREGKRTVLIAYTREALSASARHLFDELVGDPTLDATQIASLQRTIADSGAVQRVEDLISRYAKQAELALTRPELTASADVLRALGAAATTRVT